METEKKKNSPLCFLFNLLGEKGKESFVRFSAKKSLLLDDISFNGDFKDVKNILFIIPDDILEAFYQVENILSIMHKYENCSFSILTGEKSAKWFKQFHGVSSLFCYNPDEKCFFSQDMKTLKGELRNKDFDLCFILDRNRSLVLDYLITQIKSVYRISYETDFDFPYSNVRIKSEKYDHAVENNLSLSRALKIPIHDKLHWSVSKDSLEEISHAIKEQQIPQDKKGALIDVDFYVDNYGKKWTKELIENLKDELSEYSFYFYVKNADDTRYADWLRSFSLPCFIDLTPTRLAALLYKSDILISGKSHLFELAFLSKRKAIGIFKEDELKYHCRNVKNSKGISISDKPDSNTIQQIIDFLKPSK